MSEKSASDWEIEPQLLEAVFEYSRDAICVVNLETDEFVECNPAATELLGYSRAELLSMSATDVHPHNREAYERFVEGVVEDGDGWTDELTCYAKGGQKVPAEISATLYEPDGQPCMIRNAMEHGGEDVTVTVGCLSDGFYVADSGPGIPDDERDKIFDLGYTTTSAGTGYGLAIVEYMVDAHGWEIDVTESESGGAKFEITGVDFVEDN